METKWVHHCLVWLIYLLMTKKPCNPRLMDKKIIKQRNEKTNSFKSSVAVRSRSFVSEDFTLVGAWLYVVMGANQFVFLLVLEVRKPWFHSVAYCWGVLLRTPAPELMSDVEGSTATPWGLARHPALVLCSVGLASPSPASPRTSLRKSRLRSDSDSSVFRKGRIIWKWCPRLALVSTHTPQFAQSRCHSRACSDLLW